MINPFQYGGVVGKDAFCNRKRELVDLTRAMKNGERLFVYAERRMGKTSLVRLALDRLPKSKYLTAYVDLWPTDGEDSFAKATAKAITESMATSAGKMLQAAREFFGRLIPSIVTDSEGNSKVAFELARPSISQPDLAEVLAAPARISAKRKRGVVIVFDEFQRILEYGSDLAERAVRSAIQGQRGVAYVFLGSRWHLIRKMFLDESRPLYRAGGHYPLGTIGVEDWIPFIRERFEQSHKQIDEDLIGTICQRTEGHPFYTQHLCHALWELCSSGSKVGSDLVESATRLLLERESYAYTSLWESLTLNQQRFLTGLAREPEGTRVFASEFVRRYNLRSSSAAQRAAEALLERDIIDREDGSFVITDRFMRMWIQESTHHS